LSIALGRAACLNGHSVLFTTAIDVINTLAAAQSAGRLKREFQRYLKPAILIVDELGYLPIDKHGADLLFQIISQRYERAPMVITTNRAYKHWSQIFNNDSTLTSAILDRVLHHADTVIIEGKSFRIPQAQRRCAVPQDRDQHHDRGNVDLGAEKAQRRVPCAAHHGPVGLPRLPATRCDTPSLCPVRSQYFIRRPKIARLLVSGLGLGLGGGSANSASTEMVWNEIFTNNRQRYAGPTRHHCREWAHETGA